MREGTVLGTATAVAAVPFDSVNALITSGRAYQLLGVDQDGQGITIGAYPEQRMIWMHGEYWYQGEYEFAPAPTGTTVTYRIRNISGHPDAAIRLWQRRMLKAQDQSLADFIAALPGRIDQISG